MLTFFTNSLPPFFLNTLARPNLLACARWRISFLFASSSNHMKPREAQPWRRLPLWACPWRVPQWGSLPPCWVYDHHEPSDAVSEPLCWRSRPLYWPLQHWWAGWTCMILCRRRTFTFTSSRFSWVFSSDDCDDFELTVGMRSVVKLSRKPAVINVIWDFWLRRHQQAQVGNDPAASPAPAFSSP